MTTTECQLNLQKEFSSKNGTITLKEVQSALIVQLNTPTVNEFRMPRPTMELQQNQLIPTFNLQNQPERQNVHQCPCPSMPKMPIDFGNICKLI